MRTGRHFTVGAEKICLENNNLPKLHRSLPIEYTLCIEHFFTVQDFWGTCACPQKQSLPWNFSLYWIYVLHSGFFSKLCLPWKQSLPWNCSSPGVGRPPRPPAKSLHFGISFLEKFCPSCTVQRRAYTLFPEFYRIVGNWFLPKSCVRGSSFQSNSL